MPQNRGKKHKYFNVMQLETANKPKRHGDANKFEKTKPPPTTTKPTISIITTTKYSE